MPLSLLTMPFKLRGEKKGLKFLSAKMRHVCTEFVGQYVKDENYRFENV